MFKIKKSRKKIAFFDRDPRLSGKVNLIISLPLAAAFLIRCYILDFNFNRHLTVSAIILAIIMLSGIYRLLIRRGPVNDYITLGGFTNRMFLRYGRWYLYGGLIGSVAVYVAFMAGCAIVDMEPGERFFTRFGGYMLDHLWTFVVLIYITVRSYVDFIEYYRSPESSREIIE